MVIVDGEKVKFQEVEEVVLPTEFRDALDLKNGDPLVVWEDEAGVHLQNRRLAIERAQAVMKTLYIPGRSAVAEFLAERRAEAAREEQGG